MNKRMIKEKEAEIIKIKILIIQKITNIKEKNNLIRIKMIDINLYIYFQNFQNLLLFVKKVPFSEQGEII